MINEAYGVSECECRGYNLIFSRLHTERDLDKTQIFKILSGLKERPSLNAKVRKPMMKSWLRKWHKTGLITLWRDKVRLGNIALAINLLNNKNKDLLVKEIVNSPYS